MHKDTQAYVKAYDKCQKLSNVIRQPTEELTPIAMEIGYYRPFPNRNETAEVPNSQHRLLPKWVEVKTLATITEKNM